LFTANEKEKGCKYYAVRDFHVKIYNRKKYFEEKKAGLTSLFYWY